MKTILLSLAFLTQTFAATYYVSKTGNDGNACTVGAQCLTIARGAAVATSPGDIVQVGDGAYTERVTLTTSGSSGGGKITFRGHDGTGCPTTVNSDINSRGYRPAPTVTMSGFEVNANYIQIDCFKVNSSPNLGAFTIDQDRTDVDIINNYVDGSAHNGNPYYGVLMAYGILVTHMPQNVYIARNYVVNAVYGFMVYCGGNCTVEDNEVYQLKATTGGTGDDDDYSRVFGEYITMRHNYFHGNSVSDCQGDCHIDCFQTWNIGQTGEVARHVTIDRNICFNSHQGIIARDTTSAVHGTYVSHYDWKVTNNIFGYGPIGSTQPWCALFEHVGSVVFENNLCTNSGLTGYLNGADGTHYNNIHYACNWMPYSNQSGGWGDGVYTHGNNLLYEAGRTYSGWSGDVINQDPLFVSVGGLNYQLQSGSPAINAGATVSVSSDLAGGSRPVGGLYDIGPYEYGASVTTATAISGTIKGTWK